MFVPTVKFMTPEAFPLVTAVPLTIIVALACATVGVILMLVVALPTVSVYAVVADAKAGVKVPTLTAKAAKSALALAARVTVIV